MNEKGQSRQNLKPIRFFLIAIMGCLVLTGCRKPSNSGGLVKADILAFKRNGVSIEMKVQVCNLSDHPIFASTEPFTSYSSNISDRKWMLQSEFSYPDGVYPNVVMCPGQARVDASKCVTLIFKDDYRLEIEAGDSPPFWNRETNKEKNEENWKEWFQKIDRLQEVEITFMYFEKEITLEMVRSGYTKEFNSLMEKYGKHVTAKWKK